MTNMPGDTSNFERFPACSLESMPGVLRAVTQRHYGYQPERASDPCKCWLFSHLHLLALSHLHLFAEQLPTHIGTTSSQTAISFPAFKAEYTLILRRGAHTRPARPSPGSNPSPATIPHRSFAQTRNALFHLRMIPTSRRFLFRRPTIRKSSLSSLKLVTLFCPCLSRASSSGTRQRKNEYCMDKCLPRCHHPRSCPCVGHQSLRRQQTLVLDVRVGMGHELHDASLCAEVLDSSARAGERVPKDSG